MYALTEEELIVALEKALPEIAEDHQAAAQPWSPHDWVPWDDGRNFAFLGGANFDPSQASASAEVRAGLLAVLLTKDNLPSFHRVLAVYFPAFSEWRQLVGVWTAEDNRHAIALRDYLVVTRCIDPVDAEERRRIHVTAGYRQNQPDVTELRPLDVLALMAVHENQCVGFINRLTEAVSDEPLTQILAKISTDDRVQSQTFAAFLNAGLVADQDATVVAVDKALERLSSEPLGFDIADFDEERTLLASYESDETRTAIAARLVEQLKLDSVQELGEDAEAARQRIFARAGR